MRPDLVVTCSFPTFLELVFGRAKVTDSIRSRELQLAGGSTDIVERAFDLLSGTEIDHPV